MAFGGDDDAGSPSGNLTLAAKSNNYVDSQPLKYPNQANEQQGRSKKTSDSEMDTSDMLYGNESCPSMGEILLTMDPGLP